MPHLPGWFFAAEGILYYAIALALAMGWLWRGRRELARPGPPGPRPGVTIFKPLCGVDDELEANLESFLALDYEPLEIIFGTREPDDPALALARAVTARHPGRDVSFVTGRESDATNPKIAIVEHMLPLAKHPLVLLSDSNVRIAPGDLGLLARPMEDERVGMVYQPVVSIGERTVPAAIDNLRFTESAGVLAIAARAFCGQDAITGKGMLCRRDALASIDGLTSVRHVGLDDFLLGIALKEAGWRLVLSPVPAVNVQVDGSWRANVDRQVRHSIWRFKLYPWLPVAELCLTPLAYVMAALVAGGPHAVQTALGAMVVKIVLETASSNALRPVPISWSHRLLIPIKDALVIAIWIVAVFRSTVVWRGRCYRVGPRSRLHPLPSPPREST